MRPLDLDAHCQALGKPIFDLIFETADGAVRDPNALKKGICLFHAGDGHAGAADNRSDFPPPQYSRVHQHFRPRYVSRMTMQETGEILQGQV